MTKYCVSAECQQEAATSLDGESLCLKHFTTTSYSRLDDYEAKRKGPGLNRADAESARRFVNECMRQADDIEHSAPNLDNLERAKLLHIILSASELGCYLRRSPRKAATITVQLSCEQIGSAWKETAETVLLSQYGASVRCTHAAKLGETIQVLRADTGQKTTARVAWQRPSENNDIRIGVEFIACDNFWGLDWAAVEDSR